MRYANHIIMLYTLNLHSAVYQLYLNKIGRKKKCGRNKGLLRQKMREFVSIRLALQEMLKEFFRGNKIL